MDSQHQFHSLGNLTVLTYPFVHLQIEEHFLILFLIQINQNNVDSFFQDQHHDRNTDPNNQYDDLHLK